MLAPRWRVMFNLLCPGERGREWGMKWLEIMLGEHSAYRHESGDGFTLRKTIIVRVFLLV